MTLNPSHFNLVEGIPSSFYVGKVKISYLYSIFIEHLVRIFMDKLRLLLYDLRKKLSEVKEAKAELERKYNQEFPPEAQEEIKKLNELIDSLESHLKSFV